MCSPAAFTSPRSRRSSKSSAASLKGPSAAKRTIGISLPGGFRKLVNFLRRFEIQHLRIARSTPRLPVTKYGWCTYFMTGGGGMRWWIRHHELSKALGNEELVPRKLVGDLWFVGRDANVYNFPPFTSAGSLRTSSPPHSIGRVRCRTAALRCPERRLRF